jgi:hypothetical protein
MARIPTRLYGPALIAGAAATVYTGPALTKTIIRHIHVQNPSALPVTFTYSVGADAAATRLSDAFSIPAAAPGVSGSILDIFCYLIIDIGQILQVAAGTANILTITINGDQIVLG